MCAISVSVSTKNVKIQFKRFGSKSITIFEIYIYIYLLGERANRSTRGKNQTGGPKFGITYQSLKNKINSIYLLFTARERERERERESKSEYPERKQQQKTDK